MTLSLHHCKACSYELNFAQDAVGASWLIPVWTGDGPARLRKSKNAAQRVPRQGYLKESLKDLFYSPIRLCLKGFLLLQ